MQTPTCDVYIEHMSILIALISMTYIIQQGIGTAAKSSKTLEEEFKTLSTQGLYELCHSLHEHIFPTWGTPWWCLEEKSSIRKLLQGRCNRYVVQAIRDFVSFRLHRRNPLERQACSDLHLEVTQLLNIMLLDHQIIWDFLCIEEKRHHNILSPNHKNLGFLIDRQKHTAESYFRFYLMWIQELYENKNASKAVTNLCGFLYYLSSQPFDPLLPSIAHATELLEIGFV